LGYDAAKRKTGRKRHTAVDTLGLVLRGMVHAASIQDQDGGRMLLAGIQERFKRLKVIFTDHAYSRSALPAWVESTCRHILQTVLRPVGTNGFVVLPERWIVERAFAWLNRYRRLSKDYERTTENSEAVIQIRMITPMSKSWQNDQNRFRIHVLSIIQNPEKTRLLVA